MAKAEQKSRFESASHNPDDFSTGRPDKFIGVIEGGLYYPKKAKDSNRFYPTLGLRIIPDEDSGFGPFTESYSIGFFNECVISKDNKTPAGGTDDDYLALGNGKTEGLDKPVLDDQYNVIEDSPYTGRYLLGQFNKKRDWYLFHEALREADEKGIIDWSTTGSVEFLSGLRCRFDRISKGGKNDSAPKKEGEQDFKVLLPTQVLGFVKGKGSVSAASSKAKESEESTDSDLETRIKAGIITALTAAKDHKLKKGNLISTVGKTFEKSERGEVMAWIGENENLIDIEGTEFDLDELTLELSEGE